MEIRRAWASGRKKERQIIEYLMRDGSLIYQFKESFCHRPVEYDTKQQAIESMKFWKMINVTDMFYREGWIPPRLYKTLTQEEKEELLSAEENPVYVITKYDFLRKDV